MWDGRLPQDRDDFIRLIDATVEFGKFLIRGDKFANPICLMFNDGPKPHAVFPQPDGRKQAISALRVAAEKIKPHSLIHIADAWSVERPSTVDKKFDPDVREALYRHEVEMLAGHIHELPDRFEVLAVIAASSRFGVRQLRQYRYDRKGTSIIFREPEIAEGEQAGGDIVNLVNH